MCVCVHARVGKCVRSTCERACMCGKTGADLCMQRACSILPSATSQASLYFSTLLHKWHDFRKKVTESKMCVLIFCTKLVRNIFPFKNNSARY